MKLKNNMIEINTEKINQVEINMAEIKTDLSYIKESQNKMSTKLDDFIESIHKQRDLDRLENDKKYASKKIETALYWAAGVIGVLIITALFSNILI